MNGMTPSMAVKGYRIRVPDVVMPLLVKTCDKQDSGHSLRSIG